MMKSAVNALYKLLWNLDHYCPHEMFPDRERFVIEVSTGPTTSVQKQRSERLGQRFRGQRSRVRFARRRGILCDRRQLSVDGSRV
jgi:hypothetical protein